MVAAVVFGAVALLAVSFALGAFARIASGVDAPGPSTLLRKEVLWASTLLALTAGIIARPIDRPTTSFAYKAISGALGGVLVVNELLGSFSISWQRFIPVVVGVMLLVIFPAAISALTEKERLVCLSPLIGLSFVSTLTVIAGGSYLFPWYNTWALTAVMVGAVALTSAVLPNWLRLQIIGFSAVAIVLSTSRQGMLGVALIALVFLARADNVGSRFRRVGVIGGLAAIVLQGIGSSERVSELGGFAADNNRLALVHSGAHVIASSPWTGLSGIREFGTFDEALRQIGLGWATSTHNFVIDGWVRGGFAGGLLSIAFVAIACWPGRFRHRGRILGVAMLPFFLLGDQLLFYEGSAAALVVALIVGVAVSPAA